MSNYLKLLNQYRNEILFLAYQKIKVKYLETSFGIGWALVKPLVFIVSFWFCFRFGLRGGSDVDGFPYLLYLFSGYMPWFFMSEIITGAPNVIVGDKQLVNSIKFPVMSLPLINVLSGLLVHIAVMFIVFIIFIILGGFEYSPDIYYLNFIYYWITMLAFFTSLVFLLSSITVIVRDIKPLVGAVMQPIFWFTPVLYTPATPMFELIERIFNPMYYFIVGYHETLLYEYPFWYQPAYDVYIWVIIVILFLIGTRFFNRIRPIMADLI